MTRKPWTRTSKKRSGSSFKSILPNTPANRSATVKAPSATTTGRDAPQGGKPPRNKALANTMPPGGTKVAPRFPTPHSEITTAADDTRDVQLQTAQPYGTTIPRDDTRENRFVRVTPSAITIARGASRANQSKPGSRSYPGEARGGSPSDSLQGQVLAKLACNASFSLPCETKLFPMEQT